MGFRASALSSHPGRTLPHFMLEFLGQILSQTPICMGVDSINHPFAPGLPPVRLPLICPLWTDPDLPTLDPCRKEKNSSLNPQRGWARLCLTGVTRFVGHTILRGVVCGPEIIKDKIAVYGVCPSIRVIPVLCSTVHPPPPRRIGFSMTCL